jgi:phospholipid/cholesterol/gamma-HCH transport system substrate-binding protein
MDTKVNHALVGLFVILLGAAGAFAVIWLGAGGPREDYVGYRVYIRESVAGLLVDAPVKYRGVDVGRVHSIELDPDNLEQVRLLLEIKEGSIIKEDATATLESQGLLGIYYINLTGGSADAPVLTARPGEEYPVIPSRPSLFGRLEDVVTGLSKSVGETTERINRLLGDKNVEAFSESLENIRTLSRNLAGKSADIADSLEDFGVILENFRTTSANLPPLVEQMERSIQAVERMTGDLSRITKLVDETVRTTGDDVQHFTGQSLPEVSAIIVELRQTSENLRHITEGLSRDPSNILFGGPKPESGPGE